MRRGGRIFVVDTSILNVLIVLVLTEGYCTINVRVMSNPFCQKKKKVSVIPFEGL